MTDLYCRALVERAESGDGPIVFTASNRPTNGARDGLDLDPSHFLLERYRQNPVILWAHRYDSPPIGKSEQVWVDGDKLRSAVVFDRDDPLARSVERKYRAGFLNAVSIGWGYVNADGTALDTWRMSNEELTAAFYDLREISAVPVPADPGALADRQLAGLRSLSTELADLFGGIGRSDVLTIDDVRECFRALLAEHGIAPGEPGTTISAPGAEPPDPTPVVVDPDAARTLLAAFSTGDNA